MIYTVTLGPFIPELRGPQRLVLSLDAQERVTEVEYRSGLNERGIAERLVRIDLERALFLVSRICGTCSQAHSLAFCLALEQLLVISAPLRAQRVRSALAELERIAAHLASLHALFASLGLAVVRDQVATLALAQRSALAALVGVEAMPDLIVPGGLRRDLDAPALSAALEVLASLERGLYQFAERSIDQRDLLARLVDRGRLNREAAEAFGLGGPLARAAGLTADLRIDQPYAAYGEFVPNLVTQERGDSYARATLRLLEAIESCQLAQRLLRDLPAGSHRSVRPLEVPDRFGIAAVEGPHGPIRYRVEGDGRRLAQTTITTSRQFDRLIARGVLAGALLDDVLPIVLSIDPCSACTEL